MYVATKGGQEAIDASLRLLAAERRGDPVQPELSVTQIREQMRLGVDRVMSEGSLHDPELAALALKQAQGDVLEAVFLLRAWRTTLPRLATSLPLDTGSMSLTRRISSAFKDVPGGQVLGPTYDYTQRLLDFDLLAPASTVPADGAPMAATDRATPESAPDVFPTRPGPSPNPSPTQPRGLVDLLRSEGLVEPVAAPEGSAGPDLTTAPMSLPASRATRLQALSRSDEGWLLALGYATQRGYGHGHPFVGEIRRGSVRVEVWADEIGMSLDIGDIELTECQLLNQFTTGPDGTQTPQLTTSYGLAFGGAERKAMAMALVDRALRARELGETCTSPTQDEEFVLAHGDSVESSGFVQHLKLPHHVDFQAELEMLRRLQADWAQG